jgi:hypothetical protein
LHSELIKDNRGIALVAVMGLTLVIMVASMAMIYRLTNFTINVGTQNQKIQTHYTATSGVEEVRDFLWNSSCIPPLWCGWLGMGLDPSDPNYPNISDYSNITAAVTGQASPSINGSSYNVYIRDNNDDSDFTSDNDEVVLILASASGQNETRTTIESMIIYSGGNDPYKQFAQNAKNAGSTLEGEVEMNLRQSFN